MSYERKVLGATIPDAESALFEQYGKASTNEKARNDEGVVYLIRVSRKCLARCRIAKIDGGVSIEMSPHTHGLLLGLTVLGYLFFVFPGVVLTVWILFTRFLTSRVIRNRFENLVKSTEYLVQKRAAGS